MDDKTKAFLLKLAKQLDDWASSTERGGYSTQLVTPMYDKANEIRMLIFHAEHSGF